MSKYLDERYEDALDKLRKNYEIIGVEMKPVDEAAFRLGFVNGCTAMADKVQPTLTELELSRETTK
jgi:hypothetical protein